MEEIEENPRLKLLSLRSQVVPEFRDIRNIPLRDREIPQDIFQVRHNLLPLLQLLVAYNEWNIFFPIGLKSKCRCCLKNKSYYC